MAEGVVNNLSNWKLWICKRTCSIQSRV